jgi:hypothetical protein
MRRAGREFRHADFERKKWSWHGFDAARESASLALTPGSAEASRSPRHIGTALIFSLGKFHVQPHGDVFDASWVSVWNAEAISVIRIQRSEILMNYAIEIMVQSWSTNRFQGLLKALLGATRVAYFQSVAS